MSFESCRFVITEVPHDNALIDAQLLSRFTITILAMDKLPPKRKKQF